MNIWFDSASSSTASVLYSELLERMRTAPAAESGILYERGSYITKNIGGRKYLYHQFRKDGKQHHVYIGSETPELRDEIDRISRTRASMKELARAYVAAGGMETQPMLRALLSKSAACGVFGRGGVMVGTHAFRLYQSLLGVIWMNGLPTQDMDLAMKRERHVKIACPADGGTDRMAPSLCS